jgi:hypothetical protein
MLPAYARYPCEGLELRAGCRQLLLPLGGHFVVFAARPFVFQSFTGRLPLGSQQSSLLQAAERAVHSSTLQASGVNDVESVAASPCYGVEDRETGQAKAPCSHSIGTYVQKVAS